jgi:hypothetical protein
VVKEYLICGRGNGETTKMSFKNIIRKQRADYGEVSI